MNIKETFIKLTSKTYPHGTEDMLLDFLPKNIQKDEFGNYFLIVGNSKSMFTCHLDTCCRSQESVSHVIGSRFISTNQKTILGADDKSGMTVLLYMIENNIPGLYYFFIGEEVGGIGSSAAASYLDFKNYNKCVSFDRRGYNSIITEQWTGECCSNEFAKSLSKELNSKDLSFNFRPDNTGIFTDSASFIDDIPECTNISVGYFSEHQVTEKQDILFLVNLCEAVIKVDWESLPIRRDPSIKSYKQYSRYESLLKDDFGDFDDFLDDDFATDFEDFGDVYNSETLIVRIDGIKHEARIKKNRIVEEKEHIYDWVIKQDMYNGLDRVDWDGLSAYVKYDGIYEHLADRCDLVYIIDFLENIPVKDLEIIRVV